MIIGIPKEIKQHEYRVGMTPAGVKALITRGHNVFIQTNAGEGSGFHDFMYQEAGACILPTNRDVYQKSDMIIKVKEPIESEYNLVKAGQIIYTYFHFAASETLTLAMLKSNAICIAYETVTLDNGTLPLLVPMSEVAGRMSIQEGAKYLEKTYKGRGVLLGGVPGVAPAKVVILGAGIVGTQAAKMAAGLGADVSILDINLERLRYLSDIMPANVTSLYSNEYTVRELIKTADLIIGSVLVAGHKAPKLITRDMLKTMQPGTVLIDVAVDQGGCIETCQPTTHDNPTFIIDNVVHYCVANMPGSVPHTSTLALTNATLHYAIELADKDWEQACRNNLPLKKGLNIIKGKVVHEGVAEAFGLKFETWQ